MEPKILAVDFDGTLCEDAFPEIGAPKSDILALVLIAQAAGIKTILWTCRNNEALEKAVTWCSEQGLEFDAVNENLPEIREKYGGDTRKVYAHMYIDDKNVEAFSLYKEIRKHVRESNNRQSPQVAEQP